MGKIDHPPAELLFGVGLVRERFGAGWLLIGGIRSLACSALKAGLPR
ncbi:MAG TPA: hypothetical protein VGD64_02490 [Acidisarcina sp.]